jgi:phosphate starvation-inducible protein PhoH and related proteins
MSDNKHNNDNHTVIVNFTNNHQALIAFGDMNKHLIKIEKALKVRIDQIGNHIEISGTSEKTEKTKELLHHLYQSAAKNVDITSLLDDALRIQNSDNLITEMNSDSVTLKTRKHHIKPRTPNQKLYIDALKNHDMVFGVGPAGTGKTYLAVAVAVAELVAGRVNKIILTRPAVEAGENLGFLPGDLKEKVDPYLRPLYDALYDMLPAENVDKLIETNVIEIAPLAYMRGRTLANAFIILDEAQNTTATQMKMFLTRLGNGGKMAINGDVGQIDLPQKAISGLVQALEIIKNIDDIAIVTFTEDDVVRHPLVAKIIRAYNKGQMTLC